GCRVLAAKLALAVPPPARGDHAGNAFIDAGRVDRNGGAEAVTDHTDPLRIDLLASRDERQRVLGVDHLIEAADLPALALALAATAHVDAERAVAEILQHARLQLGVRFVLRTH